MDINIRKCQLALWPPLCMTESPAYGGGMVREKDITDVTNWAVAPPPNMKCS